MIYHISFVNLYWLNKNYYYNKSNAFTIYNPEASDINVDTSNLSQPKEANGVVISSLNYQDKSQTSSLLTEQENLRKEENMIFR